MSNQRRVKIHRAAAVDGGNLMMQRAFFREAASLLTEQGYSDEAFYFEQVADHITDGGTLTSDRKEISRILGL